MPFGPIRWSYFFCFSSLHFFISYIMLFSKVHMNILLCNKYPGKMAMFLSRVKMFRHVYLNIYSYINIDLYICRLITIAVCSTKLFNIYIATSPSHVFQMLLGTWCQGEKCNVSCAVGTKYFCLDSGLSWFLSAVKEL